VGCIAPTMTCKSLILPVEHGFLERVATGDPQKGLRTHMRQQRDARKAGMRGKTVKRQDEIAKKEHSGQIKRAVDAGHGGRRQQRWRVQ